MKAVVLFGSLIATSLVLIAEPAQTPAPQPEAVTAPATPTPRPAPETVSSAVQDIVKMADAGVDGKVIQTFVETSGHMVPPRVDEIVYLRDHGVASETIAALIRRGSALRAQAQQAAPQPQPFPTAPAPVQVAQPAPVYQQVVQPVVQPVYVAAQPTYINYPVVYDYGYNYSYYNYYRPWGFGFSYGYYPRNHFGGFGTFHYNGGPSWGGRNFASAAWTGGRGGFGGHVGGGGGIGRGPHR
jgi:hypothetical protein